MSETASDPATNQTNQDAAAKFESGKTHVKQAAQDIRSAAEAKAQEFRGRAGEAYEQARTRARSWQEEGEHYIRENPLRGVLTALGVGFLLGVLFRR